MPLSHADEVAAARALITRICRECPRRVAGSDDERRAHAVVAEELRALGADVDVRPFEWHRSLYQNLALHFGVGVLGSIVAELSPTVGLALHALAGGSYLADSTRAGFALRSLLPRVRSQNVVATFRAKRPVRRRIVFLAHADAAFTGIVFRPWFVRTFAGQPGSVLYKSLRVATGALGALALVDLAQLARGRSIALSAARAALTIPPLLAFALNLDVVLRNEVVPGAMDDLSGVAGLVLLARRIRHRIPDDVEVVFVSTGCEEAGLGGAQALAESMKETWGREETTILGMDGLCNGELRVFEEGEIVPVPIRPRLRAAIERVVRSRDAFADVRTFDIPVGATDALPFASLGYDAVTFGCVDATGATPRHYHLPTDTPENLEADQIPGCLDFVEAIFDDVAEIDARVNVSGVASVA
jgi:acetylornithine deacetylase/succinyl-diaminopimelate desuccinylase-like protein